jgi:hypothetical protein
MVLVNGGERWWWSWERWERWWWTVDGGGREAKLEGRGSTLGFVVVELRALPLSPSLSLHLSRVSLSFNFYHSNACPFILDTTTLGHLGALVLLLVYGGVGLVNASSYGRSALASAAEHGQLDAAALLLAKGAEVNLDAGGRGTALYWATAKGEGETTTAF